MITSKDRSYWFGASEASVITGNYNSATFKKWWLEKLDLRRNTFENKAMKTGTVFEHKILDTIPNIRKDRQILIPELQLRVNLDGETDIIYEVKTHRIENEYKVPKAHYEQVQVQMFATGKRAEILSYGLTENDYKNYFVEIDKDRIRHHTIEFDNNYIERFLNDLAYLRECYERGIMPKREKNGK